MNALFVNSNPFLPFPELFSKRLHLRALLPVDKQLVYYLRSAPAVNKYIKRVPMQEEREALAFIEMNENKVREGKLIQWTICKKEEAHGIGNICLWNFSEDYWNAEVGYSLHEGFQGKGYMQESMDLVLAYAFDRLQLKELSAYTQFDNKKSIQLLTSKQFKLAPQRKDIDNPKNRIYLLNKTTWTESKSETIHMQ